MKSLPRGRPRNFDREKVLKKAMHTFWKNGFEGTSMSDLVKVMGINTPSIYATFGSKEELFWEAVDLYLLTEGGPTARALNQPGNTKSAIRAMLQAAVQVVAAPSRPHGCLVVLGAINGSPANQGVQTHLRTIRLKTPKAILKRLQQGLADRDLPPETNISALAAFYTTVLHGLAIQARDGVSAETLLSVVDCAMSACMVQNEMSAG